MRKRAKAVTSSQPTLLPSTLLMQSAAPVQSFRLHVMGSPLDMRDFDDDDDDSPAYCAESTAAVDGGNGDNGGDSDDDAMAWAAEGWELDSDPESDADA